MGSVGEFAAVPQEAMELDLRAMLRGAIRASLEVFLQEELTALVGAEWYGRVGALAYDPRSASRCRSSP